MLEKSYQPGNAEERHYKIWEENGDFECAMSAQAAGHDVERINADPYTIVIPPPNVTGSLHMGHALNNTLQDILIRYKRMKGLDALWQPGTDHAGIATQMVVERQIAEQGKTRHYGREGYREGLEKLSPEGPLRPNCAVWVRRAMVARTFHYG